MTEIAQNIQHKTFENGLTLITESMPWLESAAFALSVPGGCRVDPEEKLGLANFTCDMVQRGCGDRSSRKFLEDLERLGTDISASVSNSHTSYGASMPARSIHDALGIVNDLVRTPHLPESQLDDGRMVCFQEIRAIEDDLAQKTMIELRRRRYADPFGRSSTGSYETVGSITQQDVASYFQQHYNPNGVILAIAGNVDFQKISERVGELFGDWKPIDRAPINEKPADGGNFHIHHESNQTHIGLAFPSIPYNDPNYFLARGSVGVLSDGMSSRLFTEVREKRGLCYTVYASMHSMKDRGSVVVYAGTSADRAQETLDVTVDELMRLSQGIDQNELDRLKVSIRSSLVMQQESSRSRAASIAGDWHHLGKIRTLDEITDIVNGLTVEKINEYVAANPPRDFNLVSLGPNPLEEPSGVSTTSA